MFRNNTIPALGFAALAAVMLSPLAATSVSAEGYYPPGVFQTQVLSRSDIPPHSHDDHHRPRQVTPAYPGMQGSGQTLLEQSGATGGSGQGQ